MRIVMSPIGDLFKFLVLALAILTGAAPAHAQEELPETVLARWISQAGPSGTFNSAYMACEAQWEKYQGTNTSSRFIGTRAKEDDFRRVDCEWTRFQYLCPEPGQEGGIAKCGTIIPSYVEIACPIGYYVTQDQLCRLKSARERDCANPCDDGGKPNPKTGNPVIISTGAKYLEALDYTTFDGLLRIGRQYRSYQVGRPIQQSILPRAQMSGLQGGWNFEFNREIQLGIVEGSPATPDATVAILLPDGTGYGFKLQSDGTWAEDSASQFSSSSGNLKLELISALPSDLSTLRNLPTTWRLTDKNDAIWTLETRLLPNAPEYLRGWPVSKIERSGYSQTFSYASDGSLSSITDSLGRTASFEWRIDKITSHIPAPSGSEPVPVAIEKVELPDGTSLVYQYEDIPAPSPFYYASSIWSQTWRGGSPSGGSRGFISRPHIPKIQRLAKVERRSSSNEILDAVQYLYEDVDYGKNITGIIDHRGERVATFTYDSSGRVLSSELAGGAERNTFAYQSNGANRLRTVTNEYGKQSEYTFSELSASNNDYQLTAVTSDATASTDATTTMLAYSNGTFLTSSTDAEGRLVTTTRDARGRPISVVEASGTTDARTTTITWHSDFNVPVTIVSPGLTETRGYDTQGRLMSVTLTDTTTHGAPYPTNGQTRTWNYSWDANGRLLSENGPLTATGLYDDLTTYTYDASGNLLVATNGLGHTATYGVYNANGQPGSVTDANGVVTTFGYDLLGRVETINRKHPTTTAFDATTSIAYDEVGNVTQLTLPATQPLIMEYDAANRLTAMRAASGERWEFKYDAAGNVERETVLRTNGSTSVLVRRQFDELGRLLRESLGTRSPAQWDYDRVSNVTGITDANGFTTAASFDALDRVVSTLAPDGGSAASTFDAQDNEVTFTDPISVTTQFVYNGFGDVIQEISPDRGTTTYEYDAAGLMIKVTDGRGQVVNYTRDILGRVTQIVPVGKPASEIITYYWDTGGLPGSYEVGRLARIDDGSGTTLFRYDHRGNLTAKQQAIGTSTTAQLLYEYDVADRITQITYPSGRLVRYGYDTHGRVILVETKEAASSLAWQTVASGHQYEPFGPVQSMSLGNGLAATNVWGVDGMLAERLLYPAQGGTALSHLAYGRDAVGRISAIADQVNPSNSILYGYDAVGRLTMAVSDGGSQGGETYSYTPGTNQLESFTDDTGTRTITYDARGNTVAEDRPGGIAVAASYDGHGRLESYDRTNIGAQTYTYNGLGDRVRVDRPSGARHFVYDQWGRVVAEYGASALNVKAEFIWGVPPSANDPGSGSGAGNSPFGGGDHIGGYAPLALVVVNGSYQLELLWVHGNHLGVPIVTTNANGQMVSPGNDFLRPGFPGQSQVLSDLYYNRNRDYDPVTGRYIQADPIGLAGGANAYLYANADPVNLIDPDGKLYFLAAPLIGGIGAGLSDAGIQAFGLWRRGCDVFKFSSYNWSDVAVSAAFGATVPGPLSAIKNTYGRYKGLKGAPRGLNRRAYADADSATTNDVLKQLARGAAVAGVKNAADGILD